MKNELAKSLDWDKFQMVITQCDALLEAIKELREVLETTDIKMSADVPTLLRYQFACTKGAAAIAKAEGKEAR